MTRPEIEAEWPGYLAEQRRPPGFESHDSLAGRALAAIADIATTAGPGRTVLVVTHGGVIGAVERHLGAAWERSPEPRGPGGRSSGPDGLALGGPLPARRSPTTSRSPHPSRCELSDFSCAGRSSTSVPLRPDRSAQPRVAQDFAALGRGRGRSRKLVGPLERRGAALSDRLDPEIAAEQAYLDAVYDRLDAMRGVGRAGGRGVRGRPPGRHPPGPARTGHRGRDHPPSPGRARHRRHAAVLRADRPASTTRTFYVGRLAVDDEDRTPLVVDWRAPVAEPFYRATALEPMGVLRRRHLLTRNGREVIGLDDEVFDPDAVEAAGLHGRSARARCSRRWSATAPAAWPTSSPRSRPSRTPRSAPTCPASSSSRAVPAPGRPRSRCTAPRTSSTRTGAGSGTRACCSSVRARCSSATSSRCSRRSVSTRCSWRPSAA